MSKQRLDVLLVSRGLAPSREKAQSLIRAGQVIVNGQVVIKPSLRFDENVDISVKQPPKFVSRGGYKLENFLREVSLDVEGKVCLDVGASTGGFTDCLLQYGASKVYAVDVGRGQLDWKLRKDSRVVSYEKLDARKITKDHVPQKVDIITVDVSFISLTKILEHVVGFLKDEGVMICLVKPQFEVHPKYVRKGIVKDQLAKKTAILKVVDLLKKLGFHVYAIRKAFPRGSKGNEEFFVLCGRDERYAKDVDELLQELFHENTST